MKKTISAVVAASLLVPAFLLWYTHRSIEQQPSPQGRELKRQLADPSGTSVTQLQTRKSGHFNPTANGTDLLHLHTQDNEICQPLVVCCFPHKRERCNDLSATKPG